MNIIQIEWTLCMNKKIDRDIISYMIRPDVSTSAVDNWSEKMLRAIVLITRRYNTCFVSIFFF
jgi:hypothetical protein